MDCISGTLDIDYILHPELDVSLLRFKKFGSLLCDTFPTFAANDTELKPGQLLCRLGYPFPEFSNFQYDATKDEIEWTITGKPSTPRFPIEGMVTRHVVTDAGKLIGFELSTPGLKGQSGGPVFGADGLVWGLQSQTASRDIDFDIDTNVIRKGKKVQVQDFAFMHVGRCIHVAELKEFMRDKGITFQEG